MEYDTGHRYPPSASLSFPHYYFAERNIPLTSPHVSRTDQRNCPIGGPTSGPRGRGGMGIMGGEDGAMENAQSRRRIAVACARCRKRKIRCSGDPGNGSGCLHCKQAGVDMNLCQFHRVGSDDASQIIANRNIATGLAYMTNPHAVISSPFYPRSMSANQYPQLDTKAVYSQTWTIPYSENTSPVDTYNLDQPAAYLPSQTTLTNVYGGNYRWNPTTRKSLQTGSNTYLDPEISMPSSYCSNGLPFSPANLRTTAVTEAQSSLNMASLHSTLPTSLPQRPHPRHMHLSELAVPQRQLPIPQPSPAQTSRNIVDQLQDQRLRSAQVMGGSPLNDTGSYSKSATEWSSEAPESENQANITGDASSTELIAQATTSASVLGETEGVMEYIPGTASVNEAVTSSASPSSQEPQQQLNFNTSTILETILAPASTSTYSNFRSYNTLTTSASEPLSILAPQNSHANLYSYSSGNSSKRLSLGDQSNEAALVSGQRYTPLNQSQTPHVVNVKIQRRDSIETRNVPLHRASMSNLDRSY